jgi:hypothetical protein
VAQKKNNWFQVIGKDLPMESRMFTMLYILPVIVNKADDRDPSSYQKELRTFAVRSWCCHGQPERTGHTEQNYAFVG